MSDVGIYKTLGFLFLAIPSPFWIDYKHIHCSDWFLQKFSPQKILVTNQSLIIQINS